MQNNFHLINLIKLSSVFYKIVFKVKGVQSSNRSNNNMNDSADFLILWKNRLWDYRMQIRIFQGINALSTQLDKRQPFLIKKKH